MAITINADTSNGLVLTPDTSGEIKLQAGGADIATVSSTGLAMASGKGLSGDASSLTNIPAANLTGSLPAGMGGKVLQVLQTVKTDTFSTTSGTLTDVTGLSVTITPSSTSSKILVMTTVWASSTYYVGHVALVRNSTEIGKANSASNRALSFLDFGDDVTVQNTHGKIQCLTGQYLDSPATTSATTYKIQAARRYDNSTSPTTYINRSTPDRDTNTYDHRKISTITVMEIAG